MKAFFKATPKPTIAGLLTEFFGEAQSWRDTNDTLEPLVELIRLVRPLKIKNVQRVDLQEIITFLKENYSCRKQLSIYLKEIFLLLLFTLLEQMLLSAFTLIRNNYSSHTRWHRIIASVVIALIGQM